MCHVMSMEHENGINISNQTTVAVWALAFRCNPRFIVSRPSRWFPPFPDNSPFVEQLNNTVLQILTPPAGSW